MAYSLISPGVTGFQTFLVSGLCGAFQRLDGRGGQAGQFVSGVEAGEMEGNFTRFPPDAPQLAGGRKAGLRPGAGCDRVGSCAP